MSTWRNNIGILLLVGTRFGTLCSVGTIDAFWEYEIGRIWYLLQTSLMLICDISTHCEFMMLFKLKLIQKREFIANFVIFRE